VRGGIFLLDFAHLKRFAAGIEADSFPFYLWWEARE